MYIDLSKIDFAGGGSGGGSSSGMTEDQELVIAMALNDLHTNKEDKQ